MQINKRWILSISILSLVLAGALYLGSGTYIAAQSEEAAADVADSPTIAIQPASTILAEVSAAGHIELVSQHYVALEVSGEVNKITVKEGDSVRAGEPLLALDTVELERAVKRAELTVEASQNAYEQLTEAADAADIVKAEAELAAAQENLADVLAGPSAAEMAAANSNLASAWARYNELLAGPSQPQLSQLDADLKRAEVAVAEAQTAYDQVAWRNDAGMTQEAAALQTATLDYESALAAYAESTAAADTSDLQSALSAAQDAQHQVDDLLNSPTAAEITTAEASVATAAASLVDLLTGASDSELREIEINLEQALVDLQEAHAKLAAADVMAPVDGVVLAMDAEIGERLNEGAVIVTLADTSQLELTIDVAEVDIVQVAVGQPAVVEIDALSGQTFAGVVEYIAPSSDATSGVVSYPVTVRLTDTSLDRVLPGMTAVATIANTASLASDGWLVPTSAIGQQEGGALVMVARGDNTVAVDVTPGAVQGEWTVVQAPELHAGDEVVGSLTSYIDAEEEFDGPGGPGGARPFGGR